MQIKVTKEDIRNGFRGNCTLCPIALAIQRQVGLLCVVDGGGAVLPYIGWDCLLPISVKRKIRMFDKGQGMLPFAFDFLSTPMIYVGDEAVSKYWEKDQKLERAAHAIQTA